MTGYMMERRYGTSNRDWLIDLPQSVDVHRLWTVTDSDGRLYVSAGLHYVNRIGYVRSKVPWTAADELRNWRYA